MPGAAALSSRYYAFVRFAPAFRSANPPSLHARAPLPAHNPQGRICCASIPIGRFPSGVAGVFSTFGKFFYVFCSHGLYFRTIFVLRGCSAYRLMPLAGKMRPCIFRKNKILLEGNFVRITDRGCIPLDRLCLHGLRSQNPLPAPLCKVANFAPVFRKDKANILSGFSLLILGGACFCGVFFFEGIYLHFADSLCLHRLGVLSASSLMPGACQFWRRLCLSPRLPATSNLQRQSRRLLLLP